MLPVANLLVSEYKWNLPIVLGIYKTGGLINLHLISLKESCCSFPQANGLPFLVKSYIGFNNFCNSGQNIIRKLTIHTKLLHPFAVVGGCSLCIASNLLLKGCTHTLLFWINISLPIYCRFVLNNWHFFGEIFHPFFHNIFNRSSNLSMCHCFDGVNNKRSSTIASQYSCFGDNLESCLCRIATWKGKCSVPWAFSDISKMCYQNMGVIHNISLSFLITKGNGKCLLNPKPDNTSHLELPNTENGYLTKA